MSQNPSIPPTPNLLSEETAIADGSEAAGVFLHELGNVLNNLLLSARLMQRQLPDEFRERMTESCQLISAAANQMQQLARFRQSRRIPSYPLDLISLVHATIGEFPAQRVQMEPTETSAMVTGTVAEVRRVVRLLLMHALTASDERSVVRVWTERGPEHIRLIVEDRGPNLPPGQLPQLFEPFQHLRPGQSLELSICKNLMRRMSGQLDAEVCPSGEGLRFIASWPLNTGSDGAQADSAR